MKDRCAVVHDWQWVNSENVVGFHRDTFVCSRCPKVKVVETRVFMTEDAAREHTSVKTPQQKLAEELEAELNRAPRKGTVS